MQTKTLEIGGTLSFQSTDYGSGPADACFEFTEHSPDHWYSDRETSVDIDAAKARQLIAALNEHFGFTS